MQFWAYISKMTFHKTDAWYDGHMQKTLEIEEVYNVLTYPNDFYVHIHT